MAATTILIFLTACGIEQRDCAEGFSRDEAGNCLVIWPEDSGGESAGPGADSGPVGGTDSGVDTGAGPGAGVTDSGVDTGAGPGTGATDGGTGSGGVDTGPPEELSTSITGRILNGSGLLTEGAAGEVWVFPAEDVDQGVPERAAALASAALTWTEGADVAYSLSFPLTEGSSNILVIYALFDETYYGTSPELSVAAGESRSEVNVEISSFITPGDEGGTDTGLLPILIGGELEDRLDVVALGDALDILVYLSEELPATGLPWEGGGPEPVAAGAITWEGDGTSYEVSFEESAGSERSYKVYARHPLVYGAATEIGLRGGEDSLNRDIRLDTYLGP